MVRLFLLQSSVKNAFYQFSETLQPKLPSEAAQVRQIKHSAKHVRRWVILLGRQNNLHNISPASMSGPSFLFPTSLFEQFGAMKAELEALFSAIQ